MEGCNQGHARRTVVEKPEDLGTSRERTDRRA